MLNDVEKEALSLVFWKTIRIFVCKLTSIMTNYNIIGREHEQAVIRSYLESGKSELIAVYGRRRVGKTYLVKSIFQNDFDFSFIPCSH